MRRRRLLGFGLCLWLLWAVPALAGGDYALTILHTNDIHAHLAAFDALGAFCDQDKAAKGACLGGTARLATAVAAERAKGGNTVLLDAGDQFQGTLFFTVFKGKANAVVMNRLGYDAMVLGNHEFDDGPVTLANFIRSLKFPMLGANVTVDAGNPLSGLVAPYIVREIGGRKVGIIGVAQPRTARMSSPGAGIAFAKPAGPVRNAVAALSAKGVDVIVVLSHAGLEGDKRLAASVAGIDVIVGGHSHVLLANGSPGAVGPCPLVVTGPDGGRTLIVTAGYWGRYLGVLHAGFDAAGHVTKYSGNPVPLDASVPEDPGMVAALAGFAKPLEAYRQTVLGQATAPLGAAMCRQEECAAGDVLAEAMLDAGRRYKAVAALVNGGSVRAGIAEGKVTLGDVLTAYPFANTLTVVTVSGTALRKALEHGLASVGLQSGLGRFPQVAGLRYAYDPGKPAGRRVVSVEVADASGRFAPLAPEADYRLAINSFLYRGGDGYAVFADQGRDVEDDGLMLSDLVCDWIKKTGTLSGRLDGRVARVNP